MATPRPRSRLLALVVAASSVLIGVLALAEPAAAHYELLGTDPAAGSAVASVPDQITLTFSGDLLADPGATVIEVVDSSGGSLAEGEPLVEGAIVTQPLTGEASGPVTVRWKVVYDDGHTGSDEFGFTVEGATPTPSTEPTTTPAPEPTTSTEPTTSPTPTVLPGPPMQSIDPLPWLIGGGILLIAIGGAVVYLLMSHARREQPPAAAPEEGSEPPQGR